MSFRNQGFYQQKKAAAERVKSELMLDLDDLHLFRLYGLGLRYVELDRGLDEATINTGCGDAVSLANYGLRKVWEYWDEVTASNALLMQTQMKKFIKDTLASYHENDGRFNKAALLLVVRGRNARAPRDFQTYALGKCETSQFGSHQVLAMVKSDELNNTDLEHAAEQCFQGVLSEIAAMKIKLATELKVKLRHTTYDHFIPVLDRLINYYRDGVVINEPILSSIMQCAIKAGCYRSDENLNYLDDFPIPYLDADSIGKAINRADDRQLKATSKIKRPDEYYHPLAVLCTKENDPNTAANVKALLPRANAYAKYMAIRRCTLELYWCHACNTAKENIPQQYLQGAEHYWRMRRIVIASLTDQECAEINGYHQKALKKASPSKSAELLIPDLLNYERHKEGSDKDIIDRNLQLCFSDSVTPRNTLK